MTSSSDEKGYGESSAGAGSLQAAELFMEKDKQRASTWTVTVVVGDDEVEEELACVTIDVHGKLKKVCRRSFFIFHVDSHFRQAVILIVEYKWFDRFILLCIVVNSILLGIYQQRATPDEDAYWLNEFIDDVADHILWGIFALEMVLKVIAQGLFFDKRTYLRDPWNVLDFVVVASGLIERLGAGGSLTFLRLFRLLRPLRSLNAVPQMKVLVNTALSSMLKLGNVLVLGMFLFMVFGIIGLQLMNGIFYRRCHIEKHPTLIADPTNSSCWSWEFNDDGRLCGGNYLCEATSGFCGGHDEDPSEDLRPMFEGGRRGFPWCEGSAPTKMVPETDFVHFDHLPAALLLIFQSMTLEGWTELMYLVEDSFSAWFAVVYFLLVVIFTNFFMLNVALAVVDEVQDEFRSDAEAEAAQAADALDNTPAEHEGDKWSAGEEGPVENSSEGEEVGEKLWMDCTLVRRCLVLAESDIFANFIMVIIFGNVVNMCLSFFALEATFGRLELTIAIDILELIFLGIFIFEMFVMVLGFGPIQYVKNPITAFDGLVVLISITELVVKKTSSDGGGGSLSALRTFRLFRVMNKIANKWTKLRVLLKAMLRTGKALNYWLILFILVLYIFTLMWMFFFAKQFHFQDADSLEELTDKQFHGSAWCPAPADGPYKGNSYHFKQWCIPRAHFDTFIWGFIAVFQVMTGENWNTIMYAGMRAAERWEGTLIPPTVIAACLFVVMILFGQTLFLSLFLSMLLSKFEEVSVEIAGEEEEKQQRLIHSPSGRRKSVRSDRTNSVLAMVRVVIPNLKDKEAAAEPIAPQPSLPGQLPEPQKGDAEHEACSKVVRLFPEEDEDEDEEDDERDVADLMALIPTGKQWPKGYAFCLLSESNPLRKLTRFLLTAEVTVRDDTRILILDNVILACILLSTLCMMIDTPLSDPRATLTKVTRMADRVFAVTFMLEMVIKLIALGLIREPDAYLRSGWNWLDGTVVMVSVVDFATNGDGPGFLRVLRILRTFRPLRVISRNEGLKVVVQTLFVSMGDLLALVIASSLFWLIFALIFLMDLQGKLFLCDGEGIGYVGPYHSNLDTNFRTPLCLGHHVINGSTTRGSYDPVTRTWSEGTCGADMPVIWIRATPDTPICVARCDPYLESHPEIEALCHRKYNIPEELPSECNTKDPLFAAQEAIGNQYIEDMQRSLTLPCGGFTVEGGKVVNNVSAVSCVKNFCPKVVGVSESCKDECKEAQFFCKAACQNDDGKPECQACRAECEAACMCQDFCTPLIDDAALCHEQGGSWVHALSQNFDNIINALLTLFEISTTEGWVDVMYAASDNVGVYKQPVRDTSMGVYVVVFPLWILLSFMFLINLAVGVIVENFNSMRQQNVGKGVMLTETQMKWVNSRKSLYGRAFFFDLTNLHELPPRQRQIYDIISHKWFEQFIMTSIVINTIMMSLAIFPNPTSWWSAAKEAANLIFAVIYLVEAVLKVFALRWNYWQDSWNRFDFVCVVATIIGIIMKFALGVDLGAATSVIRILRIARLFRLLRFLKELNRLFMCLLISIPKLINVTAILLLFLVLFTILGMSVFGTAKLPDEGTLGDHGNFQTFWRGVVTLFRASTGEAWNEIMHDLAKDERDFFRAGSWCAPQGLFKSRVDETYDVLSKKCLIDPPNACPGSWNPLSALFWIAYTLLITWMIMNLVIAVILLGYEEGKENAETDAIDLCIETWKRYDRDHKMAIPLGRAMHFVFEVNTILQQRQGKIATHSLPALRSQNVKEMAAEIPMRFARALEMKVDSDNNVEFMSAARQVLRFMVLQEISDYNLRAIERCDSEMGRKEKDKLQRLESRTNLPKSPASGIPAPETVAASIASIKLQRKFRMMRKAKTKAATQGSQKTTSTALEAWEDKDKKAESDALTTTAGLRAAAAADAVQETSAPPPAG